jgi:hypothetical protein
MDMGLAEKGVPLRVRLSESPLRRQAGEPDPE